MINRANNILIPDYDNSILSIPPTILNSFNISSSGLSVKKPINDFGSWRRIILFVIDGFGVNQWNKYRKHPILSKLSQDAYFNELTSIYPSETAAAMTSIHTGLSPQKHGVTGEHIYDRKYDTSYSYFNRKIRVGNKIPSKDTVKSPFYNILDENNVTTKLVVPEYNDRYTNSKVYSYNSNNISDAGIKLKNTITANNQREYIMTYFPHVDTCGHKHSFNSSKYKDNVNKILRVIDCALNDMPLIDDTLLLFASDHGQFTFRNHINLKKYDWIRNNVKKENESTLKISGNRRNLHLYLESNTKKVKKQLEDKFNALVFTKSEIIDNNLFGPKENVSTRFMNRVGDLVVTHARDSFWVTDKNTGTINVHGGLHKDEIRVPFVSIPLKDYINA